MACKNVICITDRQDDLKEQFKKKEVAMIRRKAGAVSIIAVSSAAVMLLLWGCVTNRLPEKGMVVHAISKVERNGMVYTSKKYQLPDGKWGSVHLDDQGAVVDRVPEVSRDILDARLRARLELQPGQRGYLAPGESVEVVFVLPVRVESYRGPEAVIEVELDDKGRQAVRIDGKQASELDLQVLQKKWLDAVEADRSMRLKQRRQVMQKLMEVNKWRDAVAMKAVERGDISIRRKVTARQLRQFAERDKGLVVSIEPWVEEKNELASAMAATSVQSWAINQGHDGSGVGIYQREANGANCPSSANMNSGLYTNVSGLSASAHANKVGNILATVAPAAHVYCDASDFMANPASRSPRPWIANHSWGADDSGAYTTRDRDFDTGIYDDGWAIFKSAGNTSGNITSPGKAFNIVTVGNYNDATSSMAGSSAYIDPDSKAEKPEVAAPGSVSTSAGNCSGTSCAAPHAAAFAADLLGRYSWLRGQPARVKALMMAGATDNIEGSARLSDKDGAGGIDYLNSGYNGTNTIWWGGNSSHFDSNNIVTTTRRFTAGQRYRVALAWLVPGSFAYAPASYHTHAYTLNMDLDLSIRSPSGTTVAGSYSWDNPFEIVDFIAPVTGTYTIRIRRFANSGTGKISMAVHSQKVL
jgi:hypothetical protein